jgi:hypothetical protein
MRLKALAAAAVFCLLAAAAQAQVYPGLIGNDTGGIIPWSPFAEANRLEIAAAHCVAYYKYPRITSVHRQYGDYIGFRCRFPGPGEPTIIRVN